MLPQADPDPRPAAHKAASRHSFLPCWPDFWFGESSQELGGGGGDCQVLGHLRQSRDRHSRAPRGRDKDRAGRGEANPAMCQSLWLGRAEKQVHGAQA